MQNRPSGGLGTDDESLGPTSKADALLFVEDDRHDFPAGAGTEMIVITG
jgi:hypothetical protein